MYVIVVLNQLVIVISLDRFEDDMCKVHFTFIHECNWPLALYVITADTTITIAYGHNCFHNCVCVSNRS